MNAVSVAVVVHMITAAYVMLIQVMTVLRIVPEHGEAVPMKIIVAIVMLIQVMTVYRIVMEIGEAVR